MVSDKVLIGASGEYYVAYRLTTLGYAVGVTTRGTRAIDLIVANVNTGKSITIQTKTASSAFKESKNGDWWQWPLGKDNTLESKNFFYAFVDLKGNGTKTPDVFIVPSSKLKTIRVCEYQSKKSAKTSMRWLGIDKDSKNEQLYKNKWDTLERALS